MSMRTPNFVIENGNPINMKRNFIIDWFLILVFILSAFSGICLHFAGHMGNHHLWHNWAVFHVIASLLFLVAAIFHIKAHWGWYKGIKKGFGNRSKTTATLSVIFLLAAVTGTILFGVNGANSGIGLFHYKIGIATIIISALHILKRVRLLRKSLK